MKRQMNSKILLAGLLFFPLFVIGQLKKTAIRPVRSQNEPVLKKAITLADIQAWPALTPVALSDFGNYAVYKIVIGENAPTFYVKQAQSNSMNCWEMGQNINDGFILFSPDERYLIYKSSGDSLQRMNLLTGMIDHLGKANDIFLLGDKKQQITYCLSGNTCIVSDISGDNLKAYQNVSDVVIKQGTDDLLLISRPDSQNHLNKLSHLNRATGQQEELGSYLNPRDFIFDKSGKIMVWLTDQPDGSCALIAKIKENAPTVIVDHKTPGMNNVPLAQSQRGAFFSNDGRLFFYVQQADKVDEQKPTSSDLLLRNYKNEALPNVEASRLAVVNLRKKPQVLILCHADESRLRETYTLTAANTEWVMFSKYLGNGPNKNWNISARPDIYLVHTKDGARKPLLEHTFASLNGISPTGKYAYWFDRKNSRWMTVNLNTFRMQNVAADVTEPVTQLQDHADYPAECGLAGWTTDDRFMLIYGRYNLWKVDPDGKLPPQNLTVNINRGNRICWRLIADLKDNGARRFFSTEKPVSLNDTLYLCGINNFDKTNLIASIGGANQKSAILHQGEDVVFTGWVSTAPAGPDPIYLMKAKYANRFLLQKMSPTDYPNLYLTDSFKTFQPVTDLHPEKAFNWWTSEVCHYRLPNGRQMDGILYKPENFDPRKKYPVIFYYYEQSSYSANYYQYPELSGMDLNIPYMVSNGYLIFVPDIFCYKQGYPGQCALTSVEAAAKYISRFPWADPHKFGLQGGSYGAWETNYIVSHSKLFAAAAPSEGIANTISAYGESGPRMAYFFESWQGRIGVPPMQRPDLYIENSPIFFADKINTPMLIMANRGDNIVRGHQGLELYTALFRANKKNFWLLDYTKQGHGLEDEQDRVDYTIRLKQFFDYYLKGLPPPVWMTTPNNSSLEIDNTGANP